MIKQLNSKSNVKQFTAADQPSNSGYPVIARYEDTSTGAQTVINLPFTVHQNAVDSFFLFLNGKALRPGVGNDFTYTLDTLGYFNSVTLNYAIAAGINIMAYKLGVKKEEELQTDNRFTQLYEANAQSFQNFVNTNILMQPTNAVGAPANGFFYSTINNRAPIVDLTRDLKARMAPDRIAFQQIQLLQNESGSNGERVWALSNDKFNQIRFVGNFSQTVAANGALISSSVNSNDYIEVTFYGTGLNLLTNLGFAYDVRVSVDGGAEGSNVFPATSSSMLLNRNYAPNQKLSLVAGLTPGVHTVKIRNGSGVNSFNSFGIEILNTSSSVLVQPGISYSAGKKIESSSAASFLYNADVTGIKGGRVLVYQTTDGSFARAFTPTNASQLNYASADHTNEDVALRTSWRSFGAANSTDFSLLTTSTRDPMFTLDDGTTSLFGYQVSAAVSYEGDIRFDVAGSFVRVTFVGTGLDVVNSQGDGATIASVSVDGVSIGNYVRPTRDHAVKKIVSGLPYGTHVVVFQNTSGGAALLFREIIVYQPKKPTLPTGATEIGDYNVMADYAANATAGLNNISTGVLRKYATRELSFTTSWGISGSPDVVNYGAGVNIFTATNGDYVEYTFFGTGVNYRFYSPSAATTATVSLQSLSTGGSMLTFSNANFAQANTATAYGASSFAAASGIISFTGVGTPGSGFNISGLPLGEYKIRITKSSGSTMYIDSFDIITPIHSARSLGPFLVNNTALVGSQGISDNRSITVLKDNQPKQLIIARGLNTNPTTTSTSDVPLPQMYGQITLSKPTKVKISFSGNFVHNTATQLIYLGLVVNGVPVGGNGPVMHFNTTSDYTVASIIEAIDLPAGNHTVYITWKVSAGTGTAYFTRILILEEQ